MQCEFYQGNRESLIAWCSSAATLEQYQTYVVQEIEQLADISLLKHLRQLQTVAQMLQAQGMDILAQDQRGAVDALFTDMVACGSYFKWSDIPLVYERSDTLDLDIQERGLLGADEGLNTALLFIVDEEHVAICRNREADHEARHPHDKSY